MIEDVFLKSKTVAILGGTFNPVHSGHVEIARCALEQYADIEHLLFMPNSKTYYKDGTAIVKREHRLAMLELAIRDMDRAGISELELDRGGVTYTVDTVRAIHEANPALLIYFIIGADSLFYFDSWVRYDEILNHATLLCARRDSDLSEMEEKSREIIKKAGHGDILFLDTPEFPFSSTEIRGRIGRGEPTTAMLPQAVRDYIDNNRLYG